MPLEDTVDSRGGPLNAPRPRWFTHERYIVVLTWAFTLFASLRVVSYLPTLWTIWEQQNSNQHSVLTWLTWLGANLTMAAWLHEHNGRRFNRAVFVNLVNATMCAATLTLIVMLRV
ncbi:MAG: hypothetical protein AD742_15725 [Methylibium sp. NZG]|nr:MAG: hypothetical protein AD742_15725 [Methylibium sp. NZG]